MSSALLESLLESNFFGVLFATLEGDGFAGAADEDFAAGEKLIFVWRLRSRDLFGAMFVATGRAGLRETRKMLLLELGQRVLESRQCLRRRMRRIGFARGAFAVAKGLSASSIVVQE